MLWKIRPHWTGEIMTSRSVVQIIIFGSSFMFKVSMYLKWFNFQKLKTFLSNIFYLECDHYFIPHYVTLSLWQSCAVLKSLGIYHSTWLKLVFIDVFQSIRNGSKALEYKWRTWAALALCLILLTSMQILCFITVKMLPLSGLAIKTFIFKPHYAT